MKLKINKWHRFQFDRSKPDELYLHKTPKRRQAGLYAIFIDNTCTYVGCSNTVFFRLKEQLRYAYIFTPKISKIEIAIKLLPDRHIFPPTAQEKKLIDKIKPQGNRIVYREFIERHGE